MNLTSVKMQTVIFNKDFDNEWFMPILRFGRGKNKQFKMKLFIKGDNAKKVGKCYDELIALKGKDIEEIRIIHDEICDKYNEYHQKQK